MSSGFYHRFAFALPFGLASTHAGVWQCRPAVTLSGRLTSDARFHASAVPSFSGPLHQPRAGIPAGTDEMFDVLHLLSNGASWRSCDYYGPYVTNQIIKEALHPYPDGLHIVTKVGARRDAARRRGLPQWLLMSYVRPFTRT